MSVVLAMLGGILLSGCHAGAGPRSELAEASAALRDQLDRMASTEQRRERLTAIASHLEDQAQAMVRRHERFLAEFDAISTERDAPAERLKELTNGYLGDLATMGDELIGLQGELRAELTAREWDEVVTLLNRKARGAAQTSAARGG